MSNKKLFLFLLTLISAMTLTVSFRSRAESIIETQDEPQVLAFEVTPSGFNPTETTLHQGKCLILLRNRSGQRDLTFWLVRESEGRVSESESQKRDWKTQVHLKPGAYILGEANHPEWRSIIRVTN